jgi:hypothetical protein
MDDTLKALKEDMLAFIDPGVAENDIEHTVSVEHHNFLRWFDALDRLSAQQREPVVRVKELKWTSVFGRPATRAESLSSIGLYIIADLDGTERFSVGLDNGACAAFLLDEAGNKQLRYSSIHEAAAAAQADYEARIKSALVEVPADAGMREAFVRVLASLAAAISILERTPKAKRAVASDKMFDQMLDDYRKALEAGRSALTAPDATTKSDGDGESK